VPPVREALAACQREGADGDAGEDAATEAIARRRKRSVLDAHLELAVLEVLEDAVHLPR